MIELNRIERAIQTVALLIQETGEMYWPILEPVSYTHLTLPTTPYV